MHYNVKGRYTIEEEKFIKSAVRQGVPTVEIAEELGRSPNCIWSKIWRMKLLGQEEYDRKKFSEDRVVGKIKWKSGQSYKEKQYAKPKRTKILSTNITEKWEEILRVTKASFNYFRGQYVLTLNGRPATIKQIMSHYETIICKNQPTSGGGRSTQ